MLFGSQLGLSQAHSLGGDIIPVRDLLFCATNLRSTVAPRATTLIPLLPVSGAGFLKASPEAGGREGGPVSALICRVSVIESAGRGNVSRLGVS